MKKFLRIVCKTVASVCILVISSVQKDRDDLKMTHERECRYKYGANIEAQDAIAIEFGGQILHTSITRKKKKEEILLFYVELWNNGWPLGLGFDGR